MAGLEDNELERVKKLISSVRWLVYSISLLLIVFVLQHLNPNLFPQSEEEPIVLSSNEEEIIDGIHVETGLIVDEGWELVRQNCISCHSSKLIIQNGMSREGWSSTIKWMQKTQKLWDLGANEKPILDYLEKNFAPKKRGRRAPLVIEEWYEIN